MSTLRVDNIKSRTGTVVTVPETNTLAVTGIVSVTSSGSITNAGTLTNTGSLNVTGGANFNNPTGIITTGTLDITTLSIGNINSSGIVTAASLDVSGNVSVGGTLTYEDVTNIDSVGIVTARGGLVTQKMLKEEVNVISGTLSANSNIYLENGCVHIFTDPESTTSTPNIKYNASTNLKDEMSVGESVVVTLITTANSAAYSANITIDGDTVTENWLGGSAPIAGGGSGVDIHTFTIIKVASSGTTDQQLTVIANHSKTS